jgi:CIC family chloride channel protein
VSPNAFALVAMAATFGAATRAPFAAIVFVFELTRDYDVLLPLMGATVLAEMIARALLRESIMTEKLARRSVTVPGEYRPDVMTTTRVREIMSTDVQTLPAGASLTEAVDRFLDHGHSAYPVVDPDGQCIGIVTRADLLTANGDSSVVADLATEPASVRPDDRAIVGLQTMLDEEVDHLTVLDGDRLVGICTRTDLLRARHAVQRADERQPGWIARLRRGEG